jgi:hypothetical protein
VNLGRASITVLDLLDNAETIQVYVVTTDAVPALGVHCDLAKLTLRSQFYGDAGIVCLGCRLPLEGCIVSVNQSPKRA